MTPGPAAGEPSRVFMTADTVGGVWSYALELAAGLSRRGIAVDLAVLGPAPASALERAQRLPGVRAFATGLPLEWTARSEHEVDEAIEELARQAARSRAEIVHLNAPALAASAIYPAPTVAVSHSCVATWWRAVRTGPMPADFGWRTALTARGLRTAGAIVTPSASHAAAVREVYGTDLAITPVHNGRSTQGARRPSARTRCVLTAGRLWDEGKNIAALDRAAARLDAPFYAAGPVEGPNGAMLRMSHLHALGSLGEADLASWCATAPIFASAARYEPFGLAALEAAAAGSALVLSDIPTFRELWDGAAVFVSDDDRFAPVLQNLLDAPARLAALAAEAAARAARYTPEAMVGSMLAVYRRLLTRSRAAA